MQKKYTIDLKIYNEENILQALEVFTEYGEITYSTGMLEISGESEDEIEVLFGELMNYILAS